MPSFSAVLLAGGQSTRMGKDKALLPVPHSDFLLWQWQLRTLEQLQPEEIFWSGPPRDGLPVPVRVVPDVVKKAGPLAGISACLETMTSDLLVVLAIDLPRMNSPYLKDLLDRCSPWCGRVTQHDNFFEPLAAVYPKVASVLAAEDLQQGRYSLQDFIREALRHDFLTEVPLLNRHLPLFQNLNSPKDFADLGTTLS